ncbi:hypothetical protein MMC30_003169 [Trapelia coarctata]|nr:hypothetical protein [Trapelia coarctata]
MPPPAIPHTSCLVRRSSLKLLTALAKITASQSLEIFAVEIANPEWQQSQPQNTQQRVNSDISFGTLLQRNIQTLSSGIDGPGSDVEGLLYVPSLPPSDPCFIVSKQYVPHNVTRKASLPANDYSLLIAHAPWISVNCTRSYLATAGSDGARGFIFYFVEGPASTPPPLPNDLAWSLDDAGQWKAHNNFPVYAVQQSDGAQIMQQLSLYSGNLTDAPNGYLLTGLYDSRSYVRLYCDVNTGSASTLPSLWVFSLIVLGMLLGIIALTSVLMHLVQSRRRQQLRRLISNGQVDLEALGIRRLRVPQQVLDQLPLFVYVAQEQAAGVYNPVPSCGSTSTSTIFEGTHMTGRVHLPDVVPSTEAQPPQRLDSKGTLPSPDTLPHLQLPYNQTNCPICLEDFVSHRTIVRKLPCPHIYHPECIDPMLQEYSSLCPYCKGKVLPVGYCPTKITNNMVRLERNIRRMRERVTVELSPPVHISNRYGRPLTLNGRMASFHRQFGGCSRANSRRSASTQLELSSVAATPLPASSTQYATPGMAPHLSQVQHDEPPALQYRGLTYLDQEGTDREASLPRWRKAVGAMFPGFS